MYYYFSSDYPAAIKINGIFYGTIGGVIKPLRVDGDTAPFIEICPLNGGQTVNFMLNREFLLEPPEQVTVTDLKGGYLVKFYQTVFFSEFSIIAQEKYQDAVITVFNENGLKISIETPNDFFAETVKRNASSAQISRFSLGQAKFVAVAIFGDKTLLLVYHLSAPVRKLFMREVDDYSTENGFTTTENFKDIAKHKVTTVWNLNNGSFKQGSVKIEKDEKFSTELLPDKLIPYAFLEALSTGDAVDEYITGNVKDNADKLSGFFGDFIGVMPPPTFRNIDEVGLIYSCASNVYRADYFTFELSNGKISNIKKAD